MTIKVVDFEENTEELKPREKIEKYWIETLDDFELISVFFWTWYKWISVSELSKSLLYQFWTKWLMQFDDINKIQEETGLPFVKSCQILAIAEYYRRVNTRDNSKIKSSQQLYNYIKESFSWNYEKLHIVCVDSQRRVLYSWVIAQWESNTLNISLAAVLHNPIKLNCKNFYLAHNHPNWICKPSQSDIEFTILIKEESKKYWLSLDDHLIIWEDWFYSFSLKNVI